MEEIRPITYQDKEAYYYYIQEWYENEEKVVPGNTDIANYSSFNNMVDRLNCSEVDEGFVPTTTLFYFKDSIIIGAVDIIIDGHTTKVDIGKMNNRYFINLAAGGRLTQVSYETPSKLKSIVGPFAYYIKGFEMLPQMKAVDIRIEYDDKVFQGEALLFLLGLTNSMTFV